MQEAAAADVAKLRAELAAAQEGARAHYSRAEALSQQLQGKAEQAVALELQLAAAQKECDGRKRRAEEEAERWAAGCGLGLPCWVVVPCIETADSAAVCCHAHHGMKALGAATALNPCMCLWPVIQRASQPMSLYEQCTTFVLVRLPLLVACAHTPCLAPPAHLPPACCPHRYQKETVKRQRLEEDHAALTARVDQLRKMAIQSSAVKELEVEIAAFRKILNCSVCGERRKNTVITKCGHAFCAECVKKNVEARNRKCPGCGHQFGANDHRPLFLT